MPKNQLGAYYSEHINRRVTQSIFDAIEFAVERATPLNRYVVINLHESDQETAATLFEAIRHKFRDWLNYRTRKPGPPARPAYIYAIENSGERPHPHVNWLVHVPNHLLKEFDRKLPQWVKKVQGDVGPFDISCEATIETHVKRLAKYIVKGTDPLYVDHFHLREMAEPQGMVWGRRAGVSPSIGREARRVAVFKRRKRRSFPGWTPRPPQAFPRPSAAIAAIMSGGTAGRASWSGNSTSPG